MVADKQKIVSLLNDYIDSKELYEETVKDIARLNRKKKTIVQDSVKGSMQEFPYAPKNYHIAGIVYTPEEESQLHDDEEVLAERARITGETKRKVEKYMNRIPARMQRIIKYKLFDEETWEAVARRIGRNANGEKVRKEFENFMKNP